MTTKEIFKLLKKEKKRIFNNYNLIASENLPSKNVIKALGSYSNMKYSEGYPNKRYYNGNKIIDKIELNCIKECKKLFKCKVANVQPLSGSIANIALISYILKPGDKILSMSLDSGGHLTHGSPSNFIGKTYKILSYPLNKNFEIDYKKLEKIAVKEKPKLIISGATCYSKKINFKKIGQIAKKINAYHLADISHIAGLIVTNYHQSPIKYADFITSTTHKTLRGPRGAIILSNNLKFEKIINQAIFPHFQGGTHQNIIAAKTICFKEAQTKSFKKYIFKTIKNTKFLCDELKKLNFSIIGNTTENHLFLIDLQNKNIKGRDAADILEKNNIIVNANSIPNDKNSPFNPSGIRLGLALETTKNISKKDLLIIINKFKQLFN